MTRIHLVYAQIVGEENISNAQKPAKTMKKSKMGGRQGNSGGMGKVVRWEVDRGTLEGWGQW